LTVMAITDSGPILKAIAGQRIPRRAWGEVTQLNNLLSEAERILASARKQSELLQRRAYFDGRAAGLANAQSEAVKHIIEAQKQARELIEASELRIVELAVSIVARIAPRLDQGELVAALAAEGLAAIQEERHVSVRVSSAAEKATRAMLDRWQLAHPEVETIDMVIDATLDPLVCVIETEFGRIEVGLPVQLDTIRTGLTAIALEPL
jgi:flagellar biosynthesis/type III secretory pathway protein FliH